jgi:hypothetical protein
MRGRACEISNHLLRPRNSSPRNSEIGNRRFLSRLLDSAPVSGYNLGVIRRVYRAILMHVTRLHSWKRGERE